MTHSQKSPSRRPRGARKQQKLVRIPHELAERVTEASEQLGISGNEFHLRALAAYLQSLRASAPEHNKADDAKTEMEAQYRIAEVLGETVRGILKAEIARAVDALAPRIARDVTTVLTPLRSEIASALSGGLRTIQGQVENLIADSILSSAASSSHDSGHTLGPAALQSGIGTNEQSKAGQAGRDKQPLVQVRGQQSPGATDSQQSLAEIARRAQAQAGELRPSVAAARTLRKSGG